MLSRRKFLQGALGFASAAIIPAGVIMPIQPIKGFTAFDLYRHYMKEWYWDGPAQDMRDHVHSGVPDDTIQAILDAQKALDEADVPQTDRIIWLPQQGIYIDNMEKA